MMNTAHDVSTDRLARALRRAARGLCPDEAATELLVAHGTWLRRSDFLDFVDYSDDPRLLGDDEPLASVDWRDLNNAMTWHPFAASASEMQVLLLAIALADGREIDLRDCITGLDEANTALVLHALARGAGQPHLVPSNR